VVSSTLGEKKVASSGADREFVRRSYIKFDEGLSNGPTNIVEGSSIANCRHK